MHHTGPEAAKGPDRDPSLKTAGEVVALAAGAVALLYFVGGAVFALRLILDNFRPDAVVNLVGQLPRETVITSGLVEAVAPAAAVGVLAALFFAWRGRPGVLDVEGNRLRVIRACLATALVAPALTLALVHDEMWETGASLAAIPLTYGVLVIGWRMLRDLDPARSDLRNVAVFGLTSVAVALAPAAVLSAGVEFEPASLCLRDSTVPREGFLIADTKDRVLLGLNQGSSETVLSFPSTAVRELRYGDDAGDVDCAVPAGSG